MLNCWCLSGGVLNNRNDTKQCSTVGAVCSNRSLKLSAVDADCLRLSELSAVDADCLRLSELSAVCLNRSSELLLQFAQTDHVKL